MSVQVCSVKTEVIVQMTSMDSPASVMQDGRDVYVKSVSKFSRIKVITTTKIRRIVVTSDAQSLAKALIVAPINWNLILRHRTTTNSV